MSISSGNIDIYVPNTAIDGTRQNDSLLIEEHQVDEHVRFLSCNMELYLERSLFGWFLSCNMELYLERSLFG